MSIREYSASKGFRIEIHPPNAANFGFWKATERTIYPHNDLIEGPKKGKRYTVKVFRYSGKKHEILSVSEITVFPRYQGFEYNGEHYNPGQSLRFDSDKASITAG